MRKDANPKTQIKHKHSPKMVYQRKRQTVTENERECRLQPKDDRKECPNTWHRYRDKRKKTNQLELLIQATLSTTITNYYFTINLKCIEVNASICLYLQLDV